MGEKHEIFPMIVDGKELKGTSGKSFDVFNPSTEERIGAVAVASTGDIEAAVASSFKAFTAWKETPAVERAAAIMKFVDLVRKEGGEIAETLTREVGKPFPQAKGEVGGFCGLLEFYAQEARRISGSVLQSDQRDRFVFVLKQPVGVVAALPPWNDPLALLGRMMGAGLGRRLLGRGEAGQQYSAFHDSAREEGNRSGTPRRPLQRHHGPGPGGRGRADPPQTRQEGSLDRRHGRRETGDACGGRHLETDNPGVGRPMPLHSLERRGPREGSGGDHVPGLPERGPGLQPGEPPVRSPGRIQGLGNAHRRTRFEDHGR